MCGEGLTAGETKELYYYCNEYAGENNCLYGYGVWRLQWCRVLSFSLTFLLAIENDIHIQSSGSEKVVLKAMGKAINKAVTIAEILKRKMPLHQITALSSCEIINVYEPLEEGLDTVVNQHYVSCVTITLSRDSAGINVDDIGYQVSSESCMACKYILDKLF